MPPPASSLHVTKPKAQRYFWAFLLIVLSPLIGLFLLVFSIYHVYEKNTYLKAPGSTVITITRPGQYTLSFVQNPPPLPISKDSPNVKLQEVQSIAVKPLKNQGSFAPPSVTLSNTPHAPFEPKNSIAKINFQQAGQYQIDVLGDFPPQKLTLSPTFLFKFLVSLFAALFIGMLGVTLGAILALTTYVKRSAPSPSPTNSLESSALPSSAAVPDENSGKTWAALCHLSALCGFIIPFGNVIAPLLLWSILRKNYPFVEDQGKEALNFQLSILVYNLISMILILVLVGLLLLPLLALFNLVSIVIAVIESGQGKRFRYAFSIHFFK